MLSADDQRWVVVDGRRWRATDPAIPPKLRAELVAELMDARRGVGAARRAGDAAAEAAARRRVHDAKVALGERGEPWWEAPSDEGRRARLASAMRSLAGHRGPDGTTCPSEVARAVGGEGWRSLLPAVRDVARELAVGGTVAVRQRGEAVDPTAPWRGPVRIGVPADAGG